MAKKTTHPPSGEQQNPDAYPQVPPRDLYPTSDIRFVILEIGKLNANVERLILDVKGHGEKINTVTHLVSFARGWIIRGACLLTVLIGLVGWMLNDKNEAIIQALKTLAKP